MIKQGLSRLSRSKTARTLATRTPLRAVSRRFVPGEDVEDLLGALREIRGEGLAATANYLGESVREVEGARRATGTYVRLLERLRAEGLDATLSVKLTQLGQDVSEGVLRENVTELLKKAHETATFVRFDMESSQHTQATLDTYEALLAAGWQRIGVVLQAYLFRTEGDLLRMNRLGARVRLCKGAYAEPEEIAFQEDDEVRGNFVRLVRMLLDGGNDPAIATHDERLIEATLAHAATRGIGKDAFEFQMLYGVRKDLQRQLLEDGHRVRVYVPYGEQWYPYLMRRLAERPANVLLIAGSVVRDSPLGGLLPGGRRRWATRRPGDGWSRGGEGGR